jgi:hypothetical protein
MAAESYMDFAASSNPARRPAAKPSSNPAARMMLGTSIGGPLRASGTIVICPDVTFTVDGMFQHAHVGCGVGGTTLIQVSGR